MRNPAITQTSQGQAAASSVVANKSYLSWLQRLRDWLWGYDFFVSYHWASGGPYAVNLAQRLRDTKYDVFLDRAEYAMGDDWKKVGARALSNTQRLILVATKEAVTESKPVEREVNLFTGKNRQVIPIVFGEELEDMDWNKSDVLSRMEDSKLRIIETPENREAGPSDETINQLIKTHGLMRRRTLRRWIISVLITLISVSALIAGYQWQVAAEEARKANLQLAQNYMRQGINERDQNNSLLKASHYLLQASAAGARAGENSISTNAQVAGAYIAQQFPQQWVQFDHGKPIERAWFNRDLQRVVTWGDGIVRLWDALTGKPLVSPITALRELKGARISPDQKWILTWGGFYTQVWDIRTGEPLSEPMEHNPRFNDGYTGGIKAARFSPDQEHVITAREFASSTNLYQLWDSRRGTAISDPLRLGSSRFSKDLKRVLVWEGDKAQLWDSHSGDPISKLMYHRGAKIKGARFSEDESRLLTWTSEGAWIWDGVTGEPLSEPLEQAGIVDGQFNQNGERALLWGGDAAWVWDFGSRELTPVTLEHKGVWRAWFVRDEELVLTLGGDEARLWIRSTGKATYPSLVKEPIVDARFSDDGQKLLTSGKDSACVWSTRTLRPLTPPIEHNNLSGARFSQDEQRILTFNSNEIKVWDSRSGVLHTVHEEAAKEGGKYWFAEDRQQILSWKKDLARLWGDSNEKRPMVSINHPWVKGVGFSKDLRRILTWGGGAARVWDSRTGEPLTAPMLLGTKSSEGALLSPDEDRVLMWYGKTIRVWDSRTGEPITPLIEDKRYLKGAKFSQDGSLILIWGNGWVDVRRSDTGESLSTPINQAKTNGAWFSQDYQRVLLGNQALLGNKDYRVQVYDSFSGKPLSPPIPVSALRIGVKFSPNQQQLLLILDQQNVEVIDIHSGKPVIGPIRYKEGILRYSFSPDGQRLLIEGRDSARVWDIRTRKPSPDDLELTFPNYGSQFSSDHRRILTWGQGTVRIWNSLTGKPLSKPMEQLGSVYAQFSPDGSQVLFWGENLARVWDGYTGNPQSRPLQHREKLKGAVFSQDNQRVLTWGGNQISVWDARSGQPLIPSIVQKNTVDGILLSSDQRRLLSWSWTKDGEVNMWSLETDFDFPKEHLALRQEVKTRRRVTENGDVDDLTTEEWDELWAAYESIAKKHLKICRHPWANWYLDRMLHRPGSCEQPGDWLQDVNPDKLHEIREMYAGLCVERGRRLLEGMRSQQAKTYFETARGVHPRHASAYEGLARTLIESGEDPVKGVEYALRSLELNPHQPPKYALATLAKGYAVTQDNSKAAQTALKLAKAYVLWQEYQPALDAYHQAFGLQPALKDQIDLDEYRKALDPVLKDFENKKDWRALATAYEQALEAGFSDSKINANWSHELASILIDKDVDISTGIIYASRSQELDPEQPRRYAINTLAQGYIKQGRYQEAIAILQDARKSVSDRRDEKVLNTTLKQAQTAKEAAAENEAANQESVTPPKATP